VTKLAFIGGGKMAEALILKLESPQNINVSDLDKKRLLQLRRKYGIKIAKDNGAAFKSGKIIILAVKPQNMAGVLGEIGELGNRGIGERLIISIAAGISLSYLQKKLPGMPIIRAMPNNPCLVGCGITALAKGKLVSKAAYKEAEKIFKAVGEVVSVPEKWMDAVTGLSGSGPAFVYQAISALILGGVAASLPKKLAQKLALQTVLGAAATVAKTGKTPLELIKMVASPGGTTVEGLKILQKYKFTRALKEAVVAAARKSKKLSQ